MAGLPYETILLTPGGAENAEHGTHFEPSTLPRSIRVVRDDGSARSWIEHLANARIVVLCIAPDSISASGIGTYLLAMALKKCVIITDSPATRGILEHEKTAIVIPQGDGAAMLDAVRRACE